MKKSLSTITSLFLLLPGIAGAAFQQPSTAHLTVVSNAVSGNNTFGFNLTKYIGSNWDSYRFFETQTANSTASFEADLDVASGVDYVLAITEPFSWEMQSAICESDNGQNVFNPAGGGMQISNIAENSHITCTFTSANLNLKDPVLIIPGIMGTEIYRDTETDTEFLWPNVQKMFLTNNDRFMDPLAYDPGDMSLFTGPIVGKPSRLFDYSERLIDEFVNQGYILGVNLFTFPYDWRKDLEDIAENELRWKIDGDILGMYGFNPDINKIDIIAHSQGGLVFKKFLSNHSEYNHFFGKVVFVGTPHLGAPKAAKALLYGDNMNVSFGPLGLDPQEVKRISRDMPSVYELLPSREYFNHANGYLGRATPISPDLPVLHIETLNATDTPEYLKQQNLNNGLIDRAEIFHTGDYDNFDFTGSGIDAYNIVGCQDATINKIVAKPDGGYALFYGPGDTTVPVVSASNIGGAVNFYALDADHGEMLTQDGTSQQIINLIAGTTLSTAGKITPYPSNCHFKGQQVAVHSPVDMHIYDGQGNHTGPLPDGSLEFGIPKVQYDIVGHDKFAFLPEGHTYRIQLEATNSGNFSFDSSQINDGKISKTAYYQDIPVSEASEAEINLNPENNQAINLDINGDGETDQIIRPTLITGGDEDTVPPVTVVSVFGTAGNAGWYRSSVQVSLSATDDSSGVLETKYKLDGQPFVPYQNPINITTEGNHTLEFYSVDNAGNNEAAQTIQINIDKTAPEFRVKFDLGANDFVFQARDGNIDIQPQCSQTQCTATDQAGNESKITFQKSKLLTLRSLALKTIKQSGTVSSFPDNLLVVNNLNLNGQLKDFNQTIAVKKQELGRVDYVKKKDISNITELTKKGFKRYSLPGVRYLEIQTKKSALNVSIK